MLSNGGAGENAWESLRQQGDQASQSILKDWKGNQSWIFMGRTDAEAPILWPPDENWLTGKDPDAGKDWNQKKRMAEHEMVR